MSKACWKEAASIHVHSPDSSQDIEYKCCVRPQCCWCNCHWATIFCLLKPKNAITSKSWNITTYVISTLPTQKAKTNVMQLSILSIVIPGTHQGVNQAHSAAAVGGQVGGGGDDKGEPGYWLTGDVTLLSHRISDTSWAVGHLAPGRRCFVSKQDQNKTKKPKKSFYWNTKQNWIQRVLKVQDTLHVTCCLKTECISSNRVLSLRRYEMCRHSRPAENAVWLCSKATVSRQQWWSPVLRLISHLQRTVTVYGAYRDRIGSIDIASIGNVCDEITLLCQSLKAATGCIPILAHLSPQHQLF